MPNLKVTFPPQVWRWYILAVVVLILDQITKHLATAMLTYAEPVVFTPFFNFTLLYNPGAAFSFLSEAGGWQRWFFTIVALVISAIIVVWLTRIAHRRYEALALALILGGALGNVYDRMVLGHVVDFIVVHYRDYYWPSFNIADAAITVGAGFLIFDVLFSKDNRHD